jgi:PPOX class probable F420-dependent enzyme
VNDLLEGPSAAVLTTYRKDGSALTTPVWFRVEDGAFEVVIAAGDVKLGHLERDRRCSILVFEAVPPFRGVEVRGEAELVDCDVHEIRADIAGRYLGTERGRRFAEERKTSGVLLRLRGERREWDLSAILPG